MSSKLIINTTFMKRLEKYYSFLGYKVCFCHFLAYIFCAGLNPYF